VNTCNQTKLLLNNDLPGRIVSGKRKFDHISSVLKELRWLPVNELLYYRDAIMAFECMTGRASGYLSTQFIRRGARDVIDRRTRNSQTLDIPLFRTTSGQRSFYYRTVTLWNSISNDLKLCKSVSHFTVNVSNFCHSTW
jgi:hypothetical protein